MIKYFLFIFLFIIVFYVSNNTIPKFETTNNNKPLIIPVSLTQIFNLGQKELISSIFWIETIQNSDVLKDENPFEYNRAKIIGNLSPYFYQNYFQSSLNLAIVKDQFDFSNQIINDGLLNYPNDYKLNFQLAFNYFFLQKRLKNGELIFDYIYDKKIYKVDNPNYPLIYSNIKRKIGEKEVAKKILIDLYNSTKNQRLKKSIQKLIF